MRKSNRSKVAEEYKRKYRHIIKADESNNHSIFLGRLEEYKRGNHDRDTKL